MIDAIADRATFEKLSGARSVRTRSLWLRYAPDGSEPPRVAFAIGRQIGNAVTRNRIRRRVVGQLRGSDAIELPPGAYLFGAMREVVSSSTGALRTELSELRQKMIEQESK
ncbi:MAG: ribonuclease P protein component [Acidobacteria bacterium]|nr:ribonuclease P protein component [Acidobacteriota bacterium]